MVHLSIHTYNRIWNINSIREMHMNNNIFLLFWFPIYLLSALYLFIHRNCIFVVVVVKMGNAKLWNEDKCSSGMIIFCTAYVLCAGLAMGICELWNLKLGVYHEINPNKKRIMSGYLD